MILGSLFGGECGLLEYERKPVVDICFDLESGKFGDGFGAFEDFVGEGIIYSRGSLFVIVSCYISREKYCTIELKKLFVGVDLMSGVL